MPDSDDGTTSTKRASHYDYQRSSLRSDKSVRSPSRPHSSQLISDFTLRATEPGTPTSPPASPLPSPVIPRRKQSVDNGHRARGDSRGSRRASRSRTGSRRGSRSGSRGRTIDQFLVPDSFHNLSRLGVLPPVSSNKNGQKRPSKHSSVAEERTQSRHSGRAKERGTNRDLYQLPDIYDNLNELEAPPPIERHRRLTQHSTLEDERAESMASRRMRASPSSRGGTPRLFSSVTALPTIEDGYFEHHRSSRIATKLYTISYLILFSILGTLARLGLQALTFYPGAPVSFSELWANVGGSLIMGMLSEDRRLFGQSSSTSSEKDQDVESDPDAARAAHNKLKKTIPLYIGLTTGFCGSFTSFSSFMRDMFFALSNDLPSPINHPGTAASTNSTLTRNGGYSVMALLAVLFMTVALCYSALKVGAHIAIILDPWTPALPFTFLRKFLDRVVVFLAFGVWLGAVIMSIFPPHDKWRGQALYACVFAPLGCLVRFYASLHLNGIKSSFPLGTFCVNIFGTAVLGMAYDLQHVVIGSGLAGGGVISCQVLQGIMDGFCGCLTTVSTWMLEIVGLRRRHAYFYGTASVAVGLGVLVIIMGSVRWSVGWSATACVT